ncbi:MAG: methyltransferase domain-containing protein [Alphaproteobacteria bacterium]|nr:methyltransferase domain-containing protein [Alphaproteobacteria bacterium]
MLWPPIQELRAFYHTPLGAVVCRHVRNLMHDTWPEVGSGTRLAQPEYVAGIGFANPYMTPFLGHPDEKDSYHIISLMPATMGACIWPKGRPNSSLLVQEEALPLADASIERMVLVHALEFVAEPEAFMREVWRVMRPDGRLIAIAPNRRSMLARSEETPFGQGRPYSARQLERLLTNAMFTVEKSCSRLFGFPSQFKLFLRMNNLIEPIGIKWGGMMGGILVMEAQKQLYAPGLITKKKPSLGLAAASE